MAQRIRITLFGRFAAYVEGEPPRLIQISAPRHRALLAYLAMQPGYGETRERLAALFWGDLPDRQARQSLRQCLLTLRQELQAAGAAPLIIDRDAVAIDSDVVSIDAREFLACAQTDDLAKLDRAVDLCVGHFLDGIDLDIEAFADWLVGVRRRMTASKQPVRVAVSATSRFDDTDRSGANQGARDDSFHQPRVDGACRHRLRGRRRAGAGEARQEEECPVRAQFLRGVHEAMLELGRSDSHLSRLLQQAKG
jgi:hypothetical protein